MGCCLWRVNGFCLLELRKQGGSAHTAQAVWVAESVAPATVTQPDGTDCAWLSSGSMGCAAKQGWTIPCHMATVLTVQTASPDRAAVMPARQQYQRIRNGPEARHPPSVFAEEVHGVPGRDVCSSAKDCTGLFRSYEFAAVV